MKWLRFFMSENILNIRLTDEEMKYIKMFYAGDKSKCVHDVFHEKLQAAFHCSNCGCKLSVKEHIYVDEDNDFFDILYCTSCGLGVTPCDNRVLGIMLG